MAGSIKKWIILGAALLGLIFILNWFIPHLLKPNKIVGLPSDTMDEYMIGAKAKRFNKEGQISEKLQIEAVYHIQGDDFMILKSPELILHRDEFVWTLKASSGKSYFNAENVFQRVELKNHVEITMKQESPENWRMLTDRLLVFPKEELASTDSPVSLQSGGLLIESIGMRGDLKAGQVTLNQEVSSYYEMPDSA